MTRTPRSYFDRLYERSEDPWDLATSWYEARKYAITLAGLPERRYASAFEPGCSVGALTEALADRCSHVLACDLHPAAVGAAQRRMAGPGCAHVRVEQRCLPEEWPTSDRFDLLVLSEVCYYFDDEELGGLMKTAVATLTPGATVVAVHWRGETDYPMTGDQANHVVGATPGLAHRVHHDEESFVLDVWRWEPGPGPT